MDCCAEQSHTCSQALHCPAPRRYCGPQLPSAQARQPQSAKEDPLSMHCISRGSSLHVCNGTYIMRSEMSTPVSVPGGQSLHCTWRSSSPSSPVAPHMPISSLCSWPRLLCRLCRRLPLVVGCSPWWPACQEPHLNVLAHHLSVSSSARTAEQRFRALPCVDILKIWLQPRVRISSNSGLKGTHQSSQDLNTDHLHNQLMRHRHCLSPRHPQNRLVQLCTHQRAVQWLPCD